MRSPCVELRRPVFRRTKSSLDEIINIKEAKLSRLHLLGHFHSVAIPSFANYHSKIHNMLSSGRRLQQAQTILVVLPSFVLFGYNLSGVGGLLSIGDFASTFPAIDTVHTVGTQHNTNSTVQVGISHIVSTTSATANSRLVGRCGRNLDSGCSCWIACMHLDRRRIGQAKDSVPRRVMHTHWRDLTMHELPTSAVRHWTLCCRPRSRCTQHERPCLAV